MAEKKDSKKLVINVEMMTKEYKKRLKSMLTWRYTHWEKGRYKILKPWKTTTKNQKNKGLMREPLCENAELSDEDKGMMN